jgi:hypothetical protein
VDPDCLFPNFLHRLAKRGYFGYERSAKRGVLSQGCLDELLIKGPARLTALPKPCSLLGRDSGFIGSRVEETEARINRKYKIL